MLKLLVFSTLVLLTLPAPVLAGYLPDKHPKSREEVAATCAMLSEKGRSWGMDAAEGSYGCQNTETGQALACNADGQCTDYVGDPRWSRIQELLRGAGKRTPL